MFFASKIGWAGIAFTLLTIGMLVKGFPQIPAKADSHKERVAAFVSKDEITKMQEILRDKGYYQGVVDGVFGLRTRASIRAYQKAENLPITGQVDTRTAAGLGVRPEASWDSSARAPMATGHRIDRAGDVMEREKPSAGIRRAERRASKASRKEVSKATALEQNDGDGANKQQAENAINDQ